MTSLLTVEGVSKHFPSRHGGPTQILHDIAFSVAEREFVLLVGGSGSGKTTLLRMIGGLESVDTGIVTLRGTVTDDPTRNVRVRPERRGLGMVFQDYALWPHLSTLENVALALPKGSARRNEAAMALLERMGLANHARKLPSQLSGGQQQRVGLARALAPRPSLLLLDEPLSNLDIELRDRLRLEIRAVAQEYGTAALFVTHDPLDIWRLADRVLVLEQGHISQIGTSRDLYEQPMTPAVARLVGTEGGFPAHIEERDGLPGFSVGGHFQPGTLMRGVAGRMGRVFIRPDGLALGQEGLPATLLHCVFEAGAWRSYWQLAGIKKPVSAVTVERPDGSATHLRCDPARLFLYGDGPKKFVPLQPIHPVTDEAAAQEI